MTVSRSRSRCTMLVGALGLAMALISTATPGSDLSDPRYGGELNIGSVYVTLSALSWDPADFNWKQNHDTGSYFDHLITADLSKSVSRGGPFAFRGEAYLPTEALKGDLAESWEWEGDLELVFHLRRGVLFPDKPGVMKSRELTAADVVWSFERQEQSPKKITNYFSHIARVYARDRYTVVFELSEYNAEWAYRFGYGYYSPILPRELGSVDIKDWRNAVGSGPFQLERYLQGNKQVYVKNPIYWGKERIGGRDYQLPFIDRFTYRIIKDEATFLTALRTGKLDMLENVRWIAVDHLKKTTPELQWARSLSTVGNFLALRNDLKPLADRRVRRALNLAVNQPEIVELFYGGHAELMAYPMHPEFGEYFEPLEEMPESIQELFTYNPEKAKVLLAEAGYPDGFTIKGQVNAADPDNMELMPLLASYLAKVGVKVEIEALEYGAYLSVMTSKNHAPLYLLRSGHVNPTTSIRKSLTTGQVWNPANYSDPATDEKIARLMLTRDEATRVRMVREMTRKMLDDAVYIWLPLPYFYSAWWPWVKNYGGEMRAGALRPGPIYARLWIDQQLKREMGFR